jgi:hypothetical protein
MRGESRSLVWGIILIIIGIIFLGNNLHWFTLDWEEIWPLFMICGGLLFWISWIANRRDTGLLMPGTILITYGLLFEFCALHGWYWMDDLWPVFILGVGLGFFSIYLFGQRDKGNLVAGLILTGISLVFFAGINGFRLFWPLVLILIGIFLLIKYTRNRPSEAEVEAKGDNVE